MPSKVALYKRALVFCLFLVCLPHCKRQFRAQDHILVERAGPACWNAGSTDFTRILHQAWSCTLQGRILDRVCFEKCFLSRKCLLLFRPRLGVYIWVCAIQSCANVCVLVVVYGRDF